jgi:CRISPR-associated protein Cst1
MRFGLTGNPFVDTGLGVLAALSGCKNLEELTLDKIHTTHGNGEQLARRNARLKSTTMIFTINSLITNPAIKDQERRILYYSSITTGILDNIGGEDVNERCESCGNRNSLDIDNLIRKILVPIGYQDETRSVGRDWFPLAGSTGSDAQALPASSRSPNMCAKCLFAVHYLPLGVILLNGKLVVFQSTSRTLWYTLIRVIAQQINERISANIIDTLGSKEGSIAATTRLLNIMNELHEEDLEPGTSLFVWNFSNSGTNPTCQIEEIPNFALRFLFTAVRLNLRNELMDLMIRDKKPEYSLLNSISKGVDYANLYPFKKYTGASTNLFILYQTMVRQISVRALDAAYRISNYIKNSTTLDKKELDSLRKDLEKPVKFSKQNMIKKLIIQMVRQNLLSFDEYYDLFVDDHERILRIRIDSWKFIKYFLTNNEQFDSLYKQIQDIQEWHTNSKLNNKSEHEKGTVPNLVREKVNYIGSIIFRTYTQEKSLERFEKEVLDRFSRGDIGNNWLKRQFTKLSETNTGFTYNDWKYLCINDQGRESAFEVLYLLRILWTKWANEKHDPSIPEEEIHDELFHLEQDTDLQIGYEFLVKQLMDDYIIKKGLGDLQKYVLIDLRNGEKGLHWFRTQFSRIDKNFNDDEYWEAFLSDPNGNRILATRLFQLHLLLANYYREHVFKERPNIEIH